MDVQRYRRTGGAQGAVGSASHNLRQFYGRGIESRDTITFRGGRINVISLCTSIQGRDGVVVDNGNFQLRSEHNNGIRVNNTTSGGVSLAAFGNIIIRNGLFDIQVRDDALSAQRTLSITGGTFNATNPNPDSGEPEE
jgi:hypothetical protein